MRMPGTLCTHKHPHNNSSALRAYTLCASFTNCACGLGLGSFRPPPLFLDLFHRGVWVDNMFNARRASQRVRARHDQTLGASLLDHHNTHSHLHTTTPLAAPHISTKPQSKSNFLPTSLAYTALLWDAYTHRKSGGLTFLTGFCFFVLASNIGRRAPPHHSPSSIYTFRLLEPRC